MITSSNLAELLKILKFTEESNGVFKRVFDGLFDATIEVDFNAKKITYPEKIKINDATACSFAFQENFVILECVTRLLDKGYRPEHIELEKRWNFGHDAAKAVKSDICVSGEKGDMLLIIECKAYGTEYAKAKKNLLADGGSLFSYWQQKGCAKRLVLYASDIEDGKVVYENEIINCSDDNNIILFD